MPDFPIANRHCFIAPAAGSSGRGLSRIAVLTAGLVCLAACGQTNPPRDDPSEVVESASQTIDADTVFLAQTIYTGTEETPTAEAVLVDDGRIVFIGARDDALARAGDAEQIDIGTATLYPGFVDAHAHLIGIGLREMTLNLDDVTSIPALTNRVAEALKGMDAGEPLYGRGWIETGWPENRFPARTDLDAVSPDNPVILVRADGHALVANSRALEAAGIDETTPDPDGGRIERDTDGIATGILIDNAQGLALALIPETSPARRRQAYETGGAVYAARGWTGLHNMSVPYDDRPIMETLASEAGDDGTPRLPLRVYNAYDHTDIEPLINAETRVDATGHIVSQAIKVYADGALGSRGAALFEPYADEPSTKGLLLTDEASIVSLYGRALDNDIQVCTHAIGDRAVALAADWYAKARAVMSSESAAADNPAAPRFRVEHTQIIRTEDIETFARSGLIASMHPSHAIGDLYFAPDRLGADRLAGAYAWQSLVDAGIVVAGGSDAPVEVGDPRIEFYAAIARSGLDGFQGPGWHPEEAVSRETALKMFTLWPAIAAFQEDDLGTIEVGKRADFTGFSGDIMTLPPADILEITPILTVVDGAVIYAAR